mmetsp:Transcript_31490/g.63517  ORF Transcript_31490/g.63517 Transcript_31490/m.63517 type:complete len:164 (+) Transcript_31490:123-614(+)
MKNILLYVFMMVVVIVIPSPHSVVVNAQQIKFTSNENIQEKHKEAHYAPRSQKYWDEHNIERPDYAKTDAEILAERGEQIGSSKLLSIALISAIFFLVFLVYAFATDNIGIITNKWNWLLELIGIRGHRLGTSTEKDRISEKEARLKRFEMNPKDMLDNMKAD